MLADLKLPEDLKNLSISQLDSLAAELRAVIVDAVAKNGGHLASNLGVVELAIALHRVFDSPKDAILWDVSHQCYAHKLLTGRCPRFDSIRRRGGLSGFTNRGESEHDFFDCGHASTSISSALGLAVSRRLRGQPGKVVAVIGDGSLTGGEAYEALLHAGEIGENLIIVLNDNQMSINRTKGAMSKYLSRLRLLPRYQSIRNRIDWFIERIPFLGKKAANLVFAFKRMCKASFYKTNLFAELDLEYVGPFDGHDIRELEDAFEHVKRVRRPIVVHVMTQKGRGFTEAEANPAKFHGVTAFSVHDGVFERPRKNTFTEAFSKSLVDAAENDRRVIAITAAMKQGTGLDAFEKRFPSRFFDVGIAEEHAVTFAAAAAMNGMRPVVAIYSTFFQRSVDQLIHDVALQDAPVIFALDRAGVVPDDGPTHQGLFDIALMRPVPNLQILTPSTASEMRLALDYALNLGHPVAIRYPKSPCPAEFAAASQPFVAGRGVFAKKSDGASALIACTGGILSECFEAAEILSKIGTVCDVFCLRFAKPFDEEAFVETARGYRFVLLVEDGVATGGIASALSSSLSSAGISCGVAAFGDGFPQNGKRAEILHDARMDAKCFADEILLRIRHPVSARQ